MYGAEYERPFEPRASLFGLLHLALTAGWVWVIYHNDEILLFFVKAVNMIAFLGFVFYGQGLVKRLNRNYVGWAAALFLFAPVALIILGRLRKLYVPPVVLNHNMLFEQSNVNHLPPVRLVTESNTLTDAVANDTFTLLYMLTNYRDNMKEYTPLFPLAAAYELNRRGEMIAPEIKTKLNAYAAEMGYTDFDQLVYAVKSMPEQEMLNRFGAAPKKSPVPKAVSL